MARLDYGKAARVRLWQESAAKGREVRVPVAPARRATDSQISYIQALLKKAGRRHLTEAELLGLSISGASRLIKDLTVQAPVK